MELVPPASPRRWGNTMLCETCWKRIHPHRVAARVTHPGLHPCGICFTDTGSGIWVRTWILSEDEET